jgi:uncharacterized repeat protein (TIGR03806 family)
LDTFQGKLLRINPDGAIPPDNPFFNTARGKYRAIWALGLRNPFGLAVQPGTGRMLINDVGDARLEEINQGVAGANYGWPESEGPTANPRHQSPLYAYGRSVGRSITGGTFYNPAVVRFPHEYVGKYFFLDFMDHWIHVLDTDNPSTAAVFATGLAGPVAIVTAPDGSLYYLNRQEWVKDERFRPRTGSVHRIIYSDRAGEQVPQLVRQSDSVTVALGQAATFQVSAAGAEPLHYQWFRNGRPIGGATGPAYVLARASAEDQGARWRCAVRNAHGSTRSKPAILRVLALREPDATHHFVPGLEFAYYEGRWQGLPDFDSLRPVATGYMANMDVGPPTRAEHFGLTYRGYIQVDIDGVYTFQVRAAGIAKLFLGAAEVAHVPGLPGSGDGSGKVALKAGKHTLLLLHAHREGPPRLELRVGLADEALRPIPGRQLCRIDTAMLAAPTISPAGGEFTGPVEVRLKTDTTDATIRYTLDGTAPTTSSLAYRSAVVLERPATVVAKSFRSDQGSAECRATFRIGSTARYGLPRRDPVTTLNVPRNPDQLPSRLSQTGIFRSLADLAPNPGIIPYNVNSPLWSDGAAKLRWVALPGDTRIGFAQTGEWRFPAGTVFVKQFEIATDPSRPDRRRRLETRLLVVDEFGGYGATYRWRVDQRDAELLREGLTEDVPVHGPAGVTTVKWTYPSRSDCLVCHTANAGFVLGVKTRQLNGAFTYPATGVTDNQLRTWNHLGLFEPALIESEISRYDRLVAVGDGSAPLEHRVRSYLDANCAQCHRPGGTRGLFDARFDTPLSRQNLLGGPLAAVDLAIPNTRLIVPGDPSRSALHARMRRRGDVYAMPPLATQAVDQSAVAVVGQWIAGLASKRASDRTR